MNGLTAFKTQAKGRHRLSSSRPGLSWKILSIVTVIGLICGISAGAAASSASASGKRVTSGPHVAKVSSVIKFSPATQAALHRLESTPQGRADLLRAFQDSYGRKATVSTSPPADSSRIQLDATCAPGISCGISSAGGWHFWIITSYATAESADLAALQPYCLAALVPETGPVGAGVCLSVGAILWALVNNWPRFTNHGVWVAVYWGHATDGRY